MENKFGIYIGRFNPIHNGHINVIEAMTKLYGSNCLIIIGSCNQQQTLRHFFAYSERKALIKCLYPTLKVAPLADTVTDAEWYDQLSDIVSLTGKQIQNAEFFGGCEADIQAMRKWTTKITLLDRYDGSRPLISATDVRDALIHDKPLDDLMPKKLHVLVKHMFEQKWLDFRNI